MQKMTLIRISSQNCSSLFDELLLKPPLVGSNLATPFHAAPRLAYLRIYASGLLAPANDLSVASVFEKVIPGKESHITGVFRSISIEQALRPPLLLEVRESEEEAMLTEMSFVSLSIMLGAVPPVRL
ncbi:hypothetical protein ACIPL1_10630 [Pseudomonas sp. NPDC090202]|uniref:hypothetical protein n=1 Tax=Pseudomonas sp. NPDC090202 TaxID=3364476 RepID=UPI003822E5CF